MLVNSSSRNLGIKTAPAIAPPMHHEIPMDEVDQNGAMFLISLVKLTSIQIHCAVDVYFAWSAQQCDGRQD